MDIGAGCTRSPQHSPDTWTPGAIALTVLEPAVPVDVDIAAKRVLGFCRYPSDPDDASRTSASIALVPRPFGRGETTPRRESPAGAPKVVAMNPAWAVDASLLESLLGGLELYRHGCEVGGLRSGPFSADECRP